MDLAGDRPTTPTAGAASSDPYRPIAGAPPGRNGYPGSTYVPPPLPPPPPSTPGVVAIPVGGIPVASPAYPYSMHSDRSTAGTYAGPPPTPGESGAGHMPAAIDEPNGVAMNAENTDYCTTSCASTFCKWMTLYVILITIAAVITAEFLPELGLTLLALLPATTLLSYLERRFRRSVIRMQMLITFFEAVAWMIPIVVLENCVNYFLIVKTKLPSEGYCGLCILSDFLQAYVIAGLFEESVKYLAVRRIIFKSYVVDPRALVVYSCCAGAAFGTVEDIMYNLQYGLGTAIVRAFTSVPLHCATALIMGTSLAEKRFSPSLDDKERWYKTLLLPILIHGSYDFATFVLADGYLAIVGFVIGILIVVFSYVYIRKRVLYLLKTHPEEVDAHQMIINGEIEAPGVCCCSPNTCPRGCYF